MITKPTVLVLGAGTSIAYGFPSGEALFDEICNALEIQSNPQFRSLQELGYSPKFILRFRNELLKSDLRSVDAFLENRFEDKELVELGKTAIALLLVPREQPPAFFESMLRRRERHKKEPDKIERPISWYQHLFWAMRQDAVIDDFHLNKLSIVTFNYDRSLEHYLVTVLENAFGKPHEQCAAQLNKLEIVHVHGSLGRLPWQQETPTTPIPLGYGKYSGDMTHIDIARKNIQIIPDANTESPGFKKAHELLNKAKRIYFLGFGYHKANVNKLRITSLNKDHKDHDIEIKGTARNLSSTVKNFIRDLSFHNPFQRLELGGQDIYDFLYNEVDLLD